MPQPLRNTGEMLRGGYSYSFNGMETDHEVSGHGNSYTTQFRQYDPRLGRWKSLDPLAGKFPDMSPFVAFNDNPVYYIDIFGLEGTEPNTGKSKTSQNGDFTYSESEPLKLSSSYESRIQVDNKETVPYREFEQPAIDLDKGLSWNYVQSEIDWHIRQEKLIYEIDQEISNYFNALMEASETAEKLRAENSLIPDNKLPTKLITSANDVMLDQLENQIFFAQKQLNSYIQKNNENAHYYNISLFGFESNLSKAEFIYDLDEKLILYKTPEGQKPVLTIIIDNQEYSFGVASENEDTKVVRFYYLKEDMPEVDIFEPSFSIPGVDIPTKTKNDKKKYYKGKGGPPDTGPWRPTWRNPSEQRGWSNKR